MYAMDAGCATALASATGRKETTVKQLKKSIMETDMTREEAIEALKKKLDYYESDKRLKAACETLIPELLDSEDERIRKEMVDYFSQYKDDGIRGVDITPWLAYLEKQKDNKFAPRVLPCSAAWFEDGEEKQKEQKPIAHENDFVSKPKTSLEILKHYLVWAENSEEDCPYTWKELAAAIKDGITALEQKPAECIEFDNQFKNQVSHLLASVINKEWEYNKGFVEYAAQQLLGYAKHEIKPAEWSEEDDAFRDLLICILKNEHPNGIFSMSAKHISALKCDVMPVYRIIAWLKSLRPQPHWKPSEEQINALYDILHPADPVNRDAVKSLYNALQKLL